MTFDLHWNIETDNYEHEIDVLEGPVKEALQSIQIEAWELEDKQATQVSQLLTSKLREHGFYGPKLVEYKKVFDMIFEKCRKHPESFITVF